jgi:serine/threonine-protein kinase
VSGKVNLKVTSGKLLGRQYMFNEHDILLFGRQDDCHVCLPNDPLVSRHHFILEINPPELRLRDLGSMNGTYVNGKKYGGRGRQETPQQGAQRKYPEVDLRHDDEIQVGETTLRVGVEMPAECVECGALIAEEARARSAWLGGGYLCDSCRAKLPSAESAERSQIARCKRCGRTSPVEMNTAQQADYLCDDCREKAENDPLELLLALFQQVRQPESVELNVPDYKILKKLGRGGMGAVYLAQHKETEKVVALKVMLARVAVGEHSRMRFQQEVEITRALRHPHIVEFLDHGSVSGVFYFLLEFCEGGSINDLMVQHGGRLSLAVAGPIMLQALEGLAFAHQQGFVHRDLKPQNILLAGKGPSWTAKVADMGLAKNFDQAGFSGMTATGSYGGSFQFMPREQVTNFKYCKPVSDVWAMGATFYNMLTGAYPRETPYGQDPIDVILRGDMVPIHRRLPGLPKRIEEIIDRSLANRISDRFQTAGEFLVELEKSL